MTRRCMIILYQARCCEVPDVVGPPISYMEKVKMFKPSEFRTQSKRALSILPHESWEVQCVSGAEVSRVCLSASPPSPDSAGTRAATHGGSFRRGIRHPQVSPERTTLAHGSLAVCAPHFWRSQNGDPAPCVFLSYLCVCRQQPHHMSRSHRGWPLLGQFLLQCVSSFHHTHRGRNEGTSNRLWTVRE